MISNPYTTCAHRLLPTAAQLLTELGETQDKIDALWRREKEIRVLLHRLEHPAPCTGAYELYFDDMVKTCPWPWGPNCFLRADK